MTTELAITPDQTGFNDKQLAALRALGVQNAPPADVALLFHQAARTGLDPFARQIYLIGRGGKYNIQTGIDGFRVIRDRSGTYRGHTEEWCGPDGKWKDVWLESKPPAASRVQVHVAGYDVPIVGIARWQEYAQESSPMWKKMPALMLAKCAEALALRKAYPQDLSGLYTADELPEAEQDADGVYVTTTMRGNTIPNQTRAHNGKTQARLRDSGGSEPEPQPTAPGAQRPGGSRTASPAAGPTEPDVVDDERAIADEWAIKSARAQTVTDARELYREAHRRGFLAYATTRGEFLGEILSERGKTLAAEEAEAQEPEEAPVVLEPTVGPESVYDAEPLY